MSLSHTHGLKKKKSQYEANEKRTKKTAMKNEATERKRFETQKKKNSSSEFAQITSC